MCMIAHRFLSPKGKGANIPNYVIDTALTRHPDGYGVAWRDPKEGLVYAKYGPQERNLFREMLKNLDADNTIEYVAHFRYATHGPEDADHAHPYSYEDPDPEVGTVLVFHNGVFGKVTTTLKESDTEVFVRDYLAKLPSRWWTNAGIRKLVDEFGGWSKLVLMTNTETVNLNHWAGEEDGGLWYSSDHRPYYSKSAFGLTDDEDWENDGWRYENGKWFNPRYTGGANSGKGQGDVMNVPYDAVKSAEIGETTNPRSNTATWMHQGHDLTPMQQFDFRRDGDYASSVVCNTCGTAGDVYIIDGKAYIDIPHAWDNEDADAQDGTVTVAEAPAGLLLPGEDSVKKAIAKAAGLTLVSGGTGLVN